jgi:hypothetical protein
MNWNSFTICTQFGQCTYLGCSWGTSRIRPSWSPSEHLLTPALSPFGGLRPKPRNPEEVVYSPNDSCSHFTQRLFPPKVPHQHSGIISYSTWQYHSHLYNTFTRTFTPFILHALFNFTSSDLHGRLAALGSLCPIQFIRAKGEWSKSMREAKGLNPLTTAQHICVGLFEKLPRSWFPSDWHPISTVGRTTYTVQCQKKCLKNCE